MLQAHLGRAQKSLKHNKAVQPNARQAGIRLLNKKRQKPQLYKKIKQIKRYGIQNKNIHCRRMGWR